MRPKKVPIRTCIGCGKKGEKWGFIRIGLTKDGRLLISPDAKGEGRGAYVCPNERCIREAVKQKRISKALRTRFCSEQLQSLREQLLGLLKGGSEDEEKKG